MVIESKEGKWDTHGSAFFLKKKKGNIIAPTIIKTDSTHVKYFLHNVQFHRHPFIHSSVHPSIHLFIHPWKCFLLSWKRHSFNYYSSLRCVRERCQTWMIYEYVNEIFELLKDSEEQRHTHTHTLIIFLSIRAVNLKNFTLHIRCAIIIHCVSRPIKTLRTSHDLMNCSYHRESNLTEAAC